MKRTPVYICTLDYVEQAVEAERRLRAGEHQHECEKCMKWYWPEHPDEHAAEFQHVPVPAYLVEPEPRIRAKKRSACEDCQRSAKTLADKIATGEIIVTRGRGRL